MNFFADIHERVARAVERLVATNALPSGLDPAKVTVEPPREAAHGDVSTNAAMVLAKPAGMKPRDLAEILAARLGEDPDLDDVTVAGPGFINMRLRPGYIRGLLADALAAGSAYGRVTRAVGPAVNVEYVSANPTGPLHAAHARGAVVGDVLANLLSFTGHAVTKEYYINDDGAQVDTLARSAYLRYCEALGEEIGTIPPGLYPGDYLKPVGEALAAAHGDALLGREEGDWLPLVREFAIEAMMALVKADLAALGVHQDLFSSERAVVAAGAVDAAFEALVAQDLIYVGTLEPPKGKAPDEWEPRPQTLFRSTRFGDDVDRPLKKSDGSWTYFAKDIAYHYDKYMRGTPLLIDVLGADHGGYVKRMQAATRAISRGEAELDIKICQLVKLLDGGAPVKMSKRAGTFVTLRDVIDAIGKDAVRFMMVSRRNDQSMDLDFQKVREQSRDNPVFYVQYAHARACSVLRHAAAEFPQLSQAPADLAAADLSSLADSAELGIILRLASWPRTVEGAAAAHEAHRIAFFLYDLASDFHTLWNKGRDESQLRFLVQGEDRKTLARLALVAGVRAVLAIGMGLIGVTPVEEM
ncbi:MAG: arginine--tRNA ligase [Alphaproteobacteria bacterium]